MNYMCCEEHISQNTATKFGYISLFQPCGLILATEQLKRLFNVRIYWNGIAAAVFWFSSVQTKVNGELVCVCVCV